MPLYFELPLEKPVLCLRSMWTNSSFEKFFIWFNENKTKGLIESVRLSANQDVFQRISDLIHIILIIGEVKIDVGVNTTEFYGRSIVGSGLLRFQENENKMMKDLVMRCRFGDYLQLPVMQCRR
ncbi:hypothetical protein L2E82_15208 [Cichorium intybus]|uniref:Uncharacterized protein n=1 Tax=Cichorium intybus TaxID=13427 RepID=A0ACB9F2L6_CICIN|nr:hypothetical protein L2E82_15208 [Cichorium intybus]